MKLDFQKFKTAVAKQFDNMMMNGELFCTAIDKDTMWDNYLTSFPAGTNPLFRERTEHDCSCCRQFVRAVGNVVSILPDGSLASIWDGAITEPAYAAVARSMSKLAKSAAIDNVFLSPVRRIGTDRNYEHDDDRLLQWDHFCVDLPARRNNAKDYHKPGPEIGPALSDARATHDVFLRGLTELTMDSLDTVQEIIAANSLYRGREYEHAVVEFAKLKHQFDKLPTADRDLFVWSKASSVRESVARIRNTAIGTLLVDLSAGVDLEDAVRKFETSIMAPANYKRPTALVSQAMVEKAQQTVEELGLTSAFERRYARLTDITVNNILWVDREIRPKLGGNLFDNVANKVKPIGSLSKVDAVPIDNFIKDILPKVTSIEVMLENKHGGNLVSLIAPKHASAGRLFKWDNNFSWTYNGDVADSVRERVKRAGGNVTGDLCCRLAWSNYDDLDLHLVEPSGNEIYHANKGPSVSGGTLDVDMNAGGPRSRDPVENIYYGRRDKMRPGNYHLYVHQFKKREAIDMGFEIEFDWLGDTKVYSYDKPMRTGERVTVLRFNYSAKGEIKILHEGLTSSKVQRTLWGLKTQDWHKVSVLMQSPNHWDGQTGIGNRHLFFMLDGCINDGQARPFFNEFLRGDLDKHRKVIEIVGAKMKVDQSDGQLSGLGFSDTMRSEVLVRVKGSVTRTLKVLI